MNYPKHIVIQRDNTPNGMNLKSSLSIFYIFQRLIFTYFNILQNFIQRDKIYRNHPPPIIFQIFRIIKRSKNAILS